MTRNPQIPPHDSDAEASVLGAMLESNEAVAVATELLKADDFYDPKNHGTFEAIAEMFAKGEAIDAVTVGDWLTREKPWAKGDVRLHVSMLLDAYPTASAAGQYARVVAECSTLRRLINAGDRIKNLGYSMPEDVSHAVAEAEWAVLTATADSSAQQNPTRRLSEYLMDDQDEIEEWGRVGSHLVGLPTGFPTLDDAVHGWQPGQLIVVGAQSGHGKTSLLARFATEPARAGKSVLFCSLEMSGNEMRRRLYAADSELLHDRLVTGDLDDAAWKRLHDSMADMSGWGVFLNSRKQQTTADIAADARRVAARCRGLDLLVVDYVQFVMPTERGIPREQQVAQVVHDLKDLAGLLECPVVTATQLNDQVNQRVDKRPKMSDIRESKAIEHTADVVLFGYWPWRHNPKIAEGDEENPDKNRHKRWDYELTLAKHRQGLTDLTIECLFKAWCFSIGENTAGSAGPKPNQPRLVA